MPYKSIAQQRKFHAMESRGEISHATVAEWDQASKGKALPGRQGHALPADSHSTRRKPSKSYAAASEAAYGIAVKHQMNRGKSGNGDG